MDLAWLMLNGTKCPTIIVDLDGTICDCTHRLNFIQNKPKDFRSFYAGIPDDKPVQGLINVINEIWRKSEYGIIIVTGRPEYTKSVTMEWLQRNNVTYDDIFFRKKNDFRPDFEIKREILNNIRSYQVYDPQIAIDDRPRNIRMFQEEGLIGLLVGNGKEF